MLLPDDVRQELSKREWHKPTNFRKHLLAMRGPVEFNLQAPSSTAAGLRNLESLQLFVRAWKDVESRIPGSIEYVRRNRGLLASVDVPRKLVLRDTLQLAEFLGGSAIERLSDLHRRLAPFQEVDEDLLSAAKLHFQRIEELTVSEAKAIALLMPQLKRGIGNGVRLRTVPFQGVGTKFVERHLTTIQRIADTWKDGDITDAGGLVAWLGCIEKGTDKLWIRLMCDETRRAMCDLSSIWVTSQDLHVARLPGSALLIVENETSAVNLPSMPGVVVIAGTGYNLNWLQGKWIETKRVAYWGDMDTWGLAALVRAQELAPGITPLMMDVETFERHRRWVIEEPTSIEVNAEKMPPLQKSLLRHILRSDGPALRLEQEYLELEFVHATLSAWAFGHPSHESGRMGHAGIDVCGDQCRSQSSQ